jgi:DNA replication and repair protein RecF
MFLKTLNLTNFRNYSHLSFNFKNQITVLIGDNAQGKSNFLEAIVFLASSKSPKADKDEELIKQDENYLRLEGEVTAGSGKGEAESEEEETNLEIAMQMQDGRLKKRVKVNGVARRVADYMANLVVVLFAPEDVNLVTGSPSMRRNHIDQLLSQIDRDYKKALTNYENVVTRKNRVLKAINEGSAGTDQLIYWSREQAQSGSTLSQKRRDFFKFINSVEKKFGDYKFEYAQSTISEERLKEYQGREVAAMNSLIGPHRDDFVFTLNDKDLSKYGSRGEQRTAVLDLKIAEVGFAESALQTRPILLLDDIFSELDEDHRQHVIDLAKLQQTVIATVEFDQFLKKALNKTDLYGVEAGKLKKI